MDSGVCIIGKTAPPPKHPPKHFCQTLLGGGVNTLAKPYQRPCMILYIIIYNSFDSVVSTAGPRWGRVKRVVGGEVSQTVPNNFSEGGGKLHILFV